MENYNPIAGDAADESRIEVTTPVAGLPRAFVPRTMADDPSFATVQANATAWERLRCRHDFEYWCARCVTVKHKTLGRDVRLVLNAPQRRVARMFERQRRAGIPIRAIMLKARQWGGSTLVQAYMAWIQSCLRENWHSIICSQVKDTSTGIRGMYAKILDNYPAELWEGDEGPAFRPYERSSNVRLIAGRGCRVTVSSIENQDAVRGADFTMAHLSEVAYWRATPSHSPEDVIRAICGSVPLIADSFVALESTANGVGNYFHREWLRSEAGLEGRLAIFVPWYEIEYYRLKPADAAALEASLTDYERSLAALGCDLEQICWYRTKEAELGSHDKMMAEFPTTPAEAFVATGNAVFDRAKVEALRAGCGEAPRRGEVAGGRWEDDAAGTTAVWRLPESAGEYVAAVDIGGCSERADYSVIVVVRTDTAVPEVVAQWRGHIHHDLLADKAMALGRFYNDALLAVESNTLESGGGWGLYVLDLMAGRYPRLYRRRVYDSATCTETTRVGFHTNRSTKEMIVSGLIARVRNGTLVERDPAACDELLTYEHRPDGSYGARAGCHDDMLMARAIALHVADHCPPAPPVATDALNFPRW